MTTRAPTTTRPSHPRRHAGLTMIEVVVATAMLAVAAAMILGAISFSANLSLRDTRRLEAMEVAHRIVVTHIRDPRELVGQPDRVRFGNHMYRFQLDEDVLVTEQGEEGGPNRRTSRKASEMDLTSILSAQLFLVRVDVYPGEADPAPGQQPLARLSRVFTLGSLDEEDLLDWLTQRLGGMIDR